MSQEMMLMIIATVAVAALVILDYYNDEGLPYCGEGGQVKYVQFLLNTAHPELFCKITGLKQETVYLELSLHAFERMACRL